MGALSDFISFKAKEVEEKVVEKLENSSLGKKDRKYLTWFLAIFLVLFMVLLMVLLYFFYFKNLT